MKQVEVYTDGACSGNPGPGGWGAVLRYRSNRKATVASSRWTYLAQNLLRNRQRFAKNTLRNKFYTVHPTEADAIFQGASHAQRGCFHKRGRPAL